MAIGTETMKSGDQGLGGRLSILLPERSNDAQRRLSASLFPAKLAEAHRGGYVATTEHGALIGPFNSLLFIPEIAEGYSSLD